MTEDFALIDFALAACSPGELAEAIGRAQIARTRAEANRRKPAAAGKGFLSRLFGRDPAGKAGSMPGAFLLVQPTGSIDGLIVRHYLADRQEAGPESPVRLSAPIGESGMSLIEYRDTDTQPSVFLKDLSRELPGIEVFGFRHSGSRHPGAHYGFHVYLDGHMTRQVVSSCLEGTAPEADWQGIDSGMPHPAETDSLPAPGTPKSEIVTPIRLASILETLGVSPETLFDDPAPDRTVLELTFDPGGLPLEDAAGIAAHRRPGPPVLTAVSGGAEGAASLPGAAPVAPSVPPPPTPPSNSAAPPLPWDAQTPSPSWEEEVTKLLLEAVEAALPEDEQILWLESLTRKLESGDVQNALTEAREMIDRGNRPEEIRRSAATRLAELFGR